jgi:DNA-binding transcriptional ArsR family regulator
VTCPTRDALATTIAVEAGIESRQLVTRPLGRRFLPHLQRALDEDGDTCLVLSFRGVQLMDGSFADEVFAQIAAARSRGEAPPRCLVLTDLDSTSYDNLELALTSRPVREPGLRNCVMPVRDSEGRVDLVGKWEDHVRVTFECLRGSESVTARELADSQALEIRAASTRLKVLYDLGLTCRHEARDDRGRLYVYMPIV